MTEDAFGIHARALYLLLAVLDHNRVSYFEASDLFKLVGSPEAPHCCLPTYLWLHVVVFIVCLVRSASK